MGSLKLYDHEDVQRVVFVSRKGQGLRKRERGGWVKEEEGEE